MRRLIAATSLVVALAFPALAQRTTGAISGTVKDATGAVLPGVAVSVAGVNIVGSQTTTTNEQGLYRFHNLPPGDYEVVFTIGGFKTVTRRGLRVGVGSTIEVDASLEVSQLQESIEVSGEAPVVDTTSNEVGTNYDRNWVENAPLRRFSFLDLVAAAPGTLHGGDGSGRTMVYGSSYDENSFQLDGVDITENFFNEYSAEPNVDAIEEVEVLSLGAPAEYGNLTGAVYNIVTRQGTNEFHGDVNFFLQSDGLTGNNSTDIRNPDGSFFDACATDTNPDRRCPWTRDKFSDFTAQLGGPIIKDKLWFFGSYQYQQNDYADHGADSSDSLAYVRDGARRYMGKLTWQIDPKHKLVGNFHLDKKDTDNGVSLFSTPTTAWTRNSDTPTPGVAYTGVLSDKTVLDVRYSGFYGSVSGGPTDPDQPRDLKRFYDFDTGIISGGHYYWYEVEPRRTTATAKVSHLADNFLGASHDFRFGVQYSDAKAKGIYGYNDFVYTYSYDYYGTSYRYGYGYDRQPFSYSGNSRNIGVFLDDNVKVTDRLSLNFGMRYDYNKAFSAEQDELDDFGNPTGNSFPQTDFYTWKTFSPRLGFNWKITGDGKTVLKGHWGRYHRSVATGEFANVIGPNVKPTFSGTYIFPPNWDPSNAATAGQFDPDSLALFEGNENLGVDPNYESPYTDQFILSLERELVTGVGASLNYVNKRGRKYAAWDEINGTYTQVPFVDDLGDDPTGNTIQLFQLTSDPAARFFQITNPDGVETDVHAVSFGILKRMSDKWMLNASGTWMRGTGLISEPGGSAFSVGIQQRGGLQFRDFGKNPNDFVNGNGRLRLDVTWNFKVQAVYQLPAGFLVSADFAHRNGPHLVRRARVPFDVTGIPEGTTIFLQKRGENGRLGDVTLLNFRLEKDFKLGEKVKVALIADALNLLNENQHEAVQTANVTSGVFWWPFDPVDPRRLMLGAKLKF
ncbi:MAG TPA: TonB-dependent receptor [Vicinamibacteria bacterium]|nr:TonB-dependent receptor [Vicinamibacteria bacterium]